MISKGEHIITTFIGDQREIVAVITTKPPGMIYYFYKFDGKDYVKLGKAESPLELEARYNVRRLMGMENDE